MPGAAPQPDAQGAPPFGAGRLILQQWSDCSALRCCRDTQRLMAWDAGPPSLLHFPPEDGDGLIQATIWIGPLDVVINSPTWLSDMEVCEVFL